jgi:hypothetical protein
MRVTNGVLPKTNIRRGSQLQKEFCERKRKGNERKTNVRKDRDLQAFWKKKTKGRRE